MIKIENDCSCCERCGNCGAKRQKHLYCDNCKREVEMVFKMFGVTTDYLCEECLKDYCDSMTQFYTVDDFNDEVEEDV